MFRRAALSVLLVLPLAAVSGDAAPQDIADYRHQVFEGLGKHMKASAMIVKGKVVAPQDLPNHARAMHETAKVVHGMFPAGTGPDAVKTDALPEVWTKKEEFKMASDALVRATLVFAEAAETDDSVAISLAFKEVGQSCGGCHKSFRKPEEKAP